jgi:hypothetical protein
LDHTGMPKITEARVLGESFELYVPMTCPPGEDCPPPCRSLPWLAPGDVCIEKVLYTCPGGPTVYGWLIVMSDVPNPCSGGFFGIGVYLIGTGWDEPEYEITVTPESINFGSVAVGTVSPPQLFEVANTGDTEQEVMISDPKTSDFYIYFIPGTQCGLIQHLDPGQSCEYMVLFKPDSPGSYQEQIYVHSQDPDSPDVVQLTGRGVQ